MTVASGLLTKSVLAGFKITLSHTVAKSASPQHRSVVHFAAKQNITQHMGPPVENSRAPNNIILTV